MLQLRLTLVKIPESSDAFVLSKIYKYALNRTHPNAVDSNATIEIGPPFTLCADAGLTGSHEF